MASLSMMATRYAHSEGHLDLTYDDLGKHLLTCGPDGDLRIYEGFNDDDPISHTVGEIAYSVVYHNEHFYVSSDDNMVQAYTFKEGEPDGIIARFMAPVTHMLINKAGTRLLAGSSDFSVKLVDMETSSQKVFQGHEAPVLSVSLHPAENLLASSSCDGSIKIWQVEEQKCIKTIPGLPKTNDFAASKTLCRHAWDQDGKYFVVPIATEVRVYDTTSWQISFILTDSALTENVSIVRFSPCWKYLAAASQNGQFVVWDFPARKVIQKMKHSKKFSITALCWNPQKVGEIAYTDNNGGLGIIENVISEVLSKQAATVDTVSKTAVSDPTVGLFDDDDDDDDLVQATNPIVGGPCDVGGPMIDDDDDDDECDIGALKKRIMGDLINDDDENSIDSTSVAHHKVPEATPAPQPIIMSGYEPTPLQHPFQSSSSPQHLPHRYMVWNSVGIILQYNTDDESSINIEFHDTAVHHSMHVTNTLGHTMAALSAEAVVLACESDEDAPSKVVCMHFSSWDNSKEWSIDMPQGEDVKAVCLGEGWVAVATDKRIVRVFSIGGVQREILSIPGPIVNLSSHNNQLMVIYHAGMGIPGDQCLGIRLQNIMGHKRSCTLSGEPVALSPKSTLAWAGFSAEGTPVLVDSHGVVRILNRANAHSWMQVASLKKQCKGKSDNYWICGIHENPQQIRAILCKGSHYPTTLPRPTVAILPYQLPMCDLNTDKGALEESLWRSRMFSQHLDWWDSQGFEVEDAARSQMLMPQQEALMKLFALACKTEREFRAVELCELMPNHHTVQLAIKYASRLRMMQLAQRLTDVARDKASEDAMRAHQRAMREDGMDSDEEEEVAPPVRQETRAPPVVKTQNKQIDEEEEMEDDGDADVSTDIYEQLEAEQEKAKPVLKFGASREATPKSLTNSQNGRKNPFKVGSQKTPTSGKGSSVFDSMEKPKSRSHSGGMPTEAKAKGKQPTVLKNKGISNIFGSNKGKSGVKPGGEKTEKTSKVEVKLLLESNQKALEEEHPDKSLNEIAELTCNDLPADEQQECQNSAIVAYNAMRKRKWEEDNKNNDTTKVQKKETQSGSNKLRNFAFEKS